MKTLIVLPLAGAGLLLAASVANGQEIRPDMQARGRAQSWSRTRTRPRKMRQTCPIAKRGGPARRRRAL
jgi:hypothetical protein